MPEGKKSYESKTLQTQTKIYETETIIHGVVFHGDDKSNEEITSVCPPTPPIVSVSQLPPPPNHGFDDFRHPTTTGQSAGSVGHSIEN